MDLRMGRLHMLGTEFSLMLDDAMLGHRSLIVLAKIIEHVLAEKVRSNRFIQLSLIGNSGWHYRGAPQIGKLRIA
jgi:type VI secretion system protein ImpG